MFSLHVILFERKDYFTDVFVELWEKLTDGTSDHIDMLENFMLQLNGLRHDTLFAARLEKFKKSTESDLCLLPPSKEALRQHIYRASYQAGYLWRQSAEELDIPDPGQWGWKKNSKGDFQPLWTTTQSSVTAENSIETCSSKTGNVHEPMLHVYPFVDAVEVVSELYITVLLNFCFCR